MIFHHEHKTEKSTRSSGTVLVTLLRVEDAPGGPLFSVTSSMSEVEGLKMRGATGDGGSRTAVGRRYLEKPSDSSWELSVFVS